MLQKILLIGLPLLLPVMLYLAWTTFRRLWQKPSASDATTSADTDNDTQTPAAGAGLQADRQAFPWLILGFIGMLGVAGVLGYVAYTDVQF